MACPLLLFPMESRKRCLWVKEGLSLGQPYHYKEDAHHLGSCRSSDAEGTVRHLESLGLEGNV